MVTADPLGRPDSSGLGPAELFAKGLAAFNARDFYDAHEYWEDLWRDFQLPDRKFVQGLIQLAVGCFHLTNDNLNGARGLFTKTLPKLEPYAPRQRGLDVAAMVQFVRQAREQVDAIAGCGDFDWSHLPVLRVSGPA